MDGAAQASPNAPIRSSILTFDKLGGLSEGEAFLTFARTSGQITFVRTFDIVTGPQFSLRLAC
jgi:hypothetical protein